MPASVARSSIWVFTSVVTSLISTEKVTLATAAEPSVDTER